MREKEKLDLKEAVKDLGGAEGLKKAITAGEKPSADALEKRGGGAFDIGAHEFIAGLGRYFVYRGEGTCPNCGETKTGLWIQNGETNRFACEECFNEAAKS